MPLSVRSKKKGKKKVYQVVEPDGRVLGTHDSRAKAQKQIQAINISKHKRKK